MNDTTSSTTDSQPNGLDYFTEAFPNAPNPSNPNGDVIIDDSGNMFGTTQAGGTTDQGSVFEATVNPDGGFEQPVALTSFTSYPSPLNGSLDVGNLVMGASGNLFGTTERGGPGARSKGSVFELAQNARSATGYAANPKVLVSFNKDGINQPNNLTTDAGGDLFGTTATGRGGAKGGAVFEVAQTARGGYRPHAQVLASFKGNEHITSNLLVTSSGIYGSVAGGKAGAGEIFELEATRSGGYRHTPTVVTPNIQAQNLATDGSGDIFAVSSTGGTSGQGAVYELGAKGSATDLVNFNGTNGADPTGITIDGAGNIYGTTKLGGLGGKGEVYEIANTSNGYVLQNPTSFTGNTGTFPGANPLGSPTLSGGFLYGTASTSNGTTGTGDLYGIRPSDIGTIGYSTGTGPSDPAEAAAPAVEYDAAAAACYVAGTRIRTATGDVPIEALVVGDFVMTASGEARPIAWLGYRRIDCRRHPRPHEVMPIRIAAHAFAPSMPARDLLVSPGHSICVDACGETLIPAAALVNGTMVVHVEVETVTYWHVELASHDLVLAEGVPSESYLEMGNRDFFVGSGVVALAGAPDAAPTARTHADFCRPFRESGPLVDAVRAVLDARTAAMPRTVELRRAS